MATLPKVKKLFAAQSTKKRIAKDSTQSLSDSSRAKKAASPSATKVRSAKNSKSVQAEKVSAATSKAAPNNTQLSTTTPTSKSTPRKKYMTGAELVTSELVGLWKNHSDKQDTTAYMDRIRSRKQI